MRRMSVKIKIKTKLVVSQKNLIEERNWKKKTLIKRKKS
jgi:hypothetical protein